MCEANAYLLKGDKEELILSSVDIIEPGEDSNTWKLVSIFGEQKRLKGHIARMNLVNHKIVFKPLLQNE